MEDFKYPENCIKVLNAGFVRLVDVMGTDTSVVQAARISYGDGTKTPSDDRTLIRYLLRNKHTTPFEMCEMKFHIRLPIFVERQMIRHRTASTNEYSGRYSEMPDIFFVPDMQYITKQSTINKQGGNDDLVENVGDVLFAFGEQQRRSHENYESFLSSGMRKELARINLPLSQYTEKYWKVDLHNLLHFLKLRLDSHAQYEIRVFAEAIAGMVKSNFPICYEAFEDYVLESLTFSKQELILLDELLEVGIKNNDSTLNKFLPNKREQTDFLNKITSIEKLGKSNRNI